MVGSPDPSVWQQILDSRFFQALAFAFSVVAAVGLAIGRTVRRAVPETAEDAELKARIEGGLIKQIAHDLHELRQTQIDLRERVVRIETILEREHGG